MSLHYRGKLVIVHATRLTTCGVSTPLRQVAHFTLTTEFSEYLKMSRCGLTRGELSTHGWLDEITQRCLALLPNGEICGYVYSAHERCTSLFRSSRHIFFQSNYHSFGHLRILCFHLTDYLIFIPTSKSHY